MDNQAETLEPEMESTQIELHNTNLSDRISTVAFLIAFFVLLVFWDIAQRFAYYVLGIDVLHKVSGALNKAILRLLSLTTGAKFIFEKSAELEEGIPYLIVSNHQSMFDVSMLYSYFSDRDPRFIAKKELSKWIPGISFNLRAGEHGIIDRGNSGQALKTIVALARRMEKERFVTVLFPEGTRARTGELKPFKPAGFAAVMKNSPSAKVALVAIDGSWKLNSGKGRVIKRGVRTNFRLFRVLDPKEFESPDALVEQAHRLISEQLQDIRG